MSEDTKRKHSISSPPMSRVSEESSSDLSLQELEELLLPLMTRAANGQPVDEIKLEELLQKKEENLEYQTKIQLEWKHWHDEHEAYFTECVHITRSFVPPTVFSDNLGSLALYGLSSEVAKRIFQKQCLWLVRMQDTDIMKLHEADLYGRYSTSMLDLVEVAAVYSCLPDRFSLDPLGKKMAWKEG
jgi:hypothetical protein